jgi:type I restriction enzyme, S subunit
MSDLPSGWTETTLGEIADTSLGKMLDRGKSQGGYLVPYLRNSNVQWGHIDLDDVLTMDIPLEERGFFGLRPGDLLVCEGGEIGRCAIWAGSSGYMAFQKALHRVRPCEGIPAKFFLYLLEYLSKTGVLSSFATGSTIKHLPQEQLRRLPVNLPPLAEQQRIIGALEDHLSRLSAAQRYIDRASNATVTMRTSLRSREIVGHGEGVMLGSPLNPGWTWGRLGDLLVDIEAGKSFTCEPRRAEYDEWGIIKVSAMTWGEFREEENKAVPGGRKIDPRHEIHPGDVLVSRANTEEYVGAPVLVRSCRRGLLLSDKSLRLVPKSWVDKEWLVQLLASSLVRRQISMTATGNQDSMRNISQRDLRMIRVPIPPEEDQARIADSLRQQLDGIDHQSMQVDHVKARATVLRRSLLADAFAGKLVPQDSTEEPASMLLDRIRVQRAAQMPARRGRGTRRPVLQKEMLI